MWKFKHGLDFIYWNLVSQMESYIVGFIVGKHGKIPEIDENRETGKMVEVCAKEIRRAIVCQEEKDKTI